MSKAKLVSTTPAFMTTMPKAVPDVEFDALTISVFDSMGENNRRIQEISLIGVAAYLTKKHDDYGKSRQLQRLLNGMYQRGGQDLKCWVDWLQKLINVKVSTRKNETTGKEEYVISKAVKKAVPARLYRGKVKSWWTSSKTPAVTVTTVEALFRQLHKIANGEAGDKVITPEARKAAIGLFEIEGVDAFVTTAEAIDNEFIKPFKKDKAALVAAVKKAA
jgi:hypothetical protein